MKQITKPRRIYMIAKIAYIWSSK